MMDYAPILVISRKEVEAGDTASAMEVLQSCLASPRHALSLFQQMDIAFHGYDDVSWDLWEIEAVRAYVSALDDKFPFWLFFLSKFGLGLQCIMLCFMPPFLNEAGRKRIVPERLGALLTKRWFPATNQICEWVGFSDGQIERLSDEVSEYFVNGPLKV